jgi:hypothetical protein
VIAALAAAAAFSVHLVGTQPAQAGRVEVALTAPAGHVSVLAPVGWRARQDLPPGTVVANWRAGVVTVADPSDTSCGPLRLFPAEGRVEGCLPGPALIDLPFVAGVFTNPPLTGLYSWRALVTPASGDAYELQSQVPIPHVLTARVRAGRVSGRLSFEGLPEQGARVRILSVRGRLFGTATTRGDGSYVLRRRLRGVRRVLARTLERPAACARPTLARCTATVAPAFAPSTGA